MTKKCNRKKKKIRIYTYTHFLMLRERVRERGGGGGINKVGVLRGHDPKRIKPFTTDKS